MTESVHAETMNAGQHISLRIPSSPEHVSTARLFIAAVGRQFGLEEDLIEDLRVAVSEACNGAIHVLSNGDQTVIDIELVVSERLEVQVRTSGRLPEITPEWDPKTPTEKFQHTLGIGLMTALFEDSKWENREEGLRITFSAPLGEGN